MECLATGMFALSGKAMITTTQCKFGCTTKRFASIIGLQANLRLTLYISSITGRTIPTARTRHVQLPKQTSRPSFRHVTCSSASRATTTAPDASAYTNKAIADRQAELSQSDTIQYPRLDKELVPSTTITRVISNYAYLKPDEAAANGKQYKIAGRISLIRKSGGKLAFVDVVERTGQQKLQVLLNLNAIDGIEKKAFTDRIRLIRRGDIISVTGSPCRTTSGELSLRASRLPDILSPCLHTIPLVQSSETQSVDLDLLDRHVEMLASPQVIDALVIRSRLLSSMRDFFKGRSFEEVQTPILAAAAGGATARPFETAAREFPDRKLALRVAPELWLKRLILGGMSRVFEIGPSFRNEGLDKTHNPEFTTCEFYAAYYTLRDLQGMTEDMLRTISTTLASRNLTTISRPPAELFQAPFAEIDFILAINSHLNQPLPNLSSPETAIPEILSIFQSHDIPLPTSPTLPRLLDKLCSHYLEPQCTNPTWIINTPACLSPLAKSFTHPTAPNAQPVAARAELFINSCELVNCYEEENSPFEQRRKFIEQRQLSRVITPSSQPKYDDEAMSPDEPYLRALEWGLPPTGGWGCGIDRLVMLFTGRPRIGDVLSFGSLRAVTRGAERWGVGGSESDSKASPGSDGARTGEGSKGSEGAKSPGHDAV